MGAYNSFRFNAAPLTLETIKWRTKAALKSTNSTGVLPLPVASAALDAWKELLAKKDHTTRVVSNDQHAANKELHKFMWDPRVRVWERGSLLQRYLTTQPWPSGAESLELIQRYWDSGSRGTRDKELCTVALKQSIYQKDFDTAFAYVKLVRQGSSSRMSWPVVSGITGIGSMLIFPFGLSPMLHLLYCAYATVLAQSWFNVLTTTEAVRWANNVPILHRVRDRDVLQMTNRIVVGYREFCESNATNYHLDIFNEQPGGMDSVQFYSELRNLGLRPVDSEDDRLYQEYWKTAGNGFEWVEPDQEPTDERLGRHV